MGSRAFVFPGQGAQYVGMGRSLFEKNDRAKELFNLCDKVLGRPLADVCFNGPDEELTKTGICQPAIFAHSYIAYEVLGRPAPDLVFGLSLGELTACCVAGVFDFETGLRVVAERGRWMQEACKKTSGAMICLLGGTEEDIQQICAEYDVECSNRNCSGQVVISGEMAKINHAEEAARKMPFKKVVRLNVDGAYHSRLMAGAAEKFDNYLEGVEFHAPKFPILTNVTGEEVKTPEDIRQMLVKQITSTVLFQSCCQKAVALGVDTFIECGPGRTLSGMIRRMDRTLAVSNYDTWDDFS